MRYFESYGYGMRVIVEKTTTTVISGSARPNSFLGDAIRKLIWCVPRHDVGHSLMGMPSLNGQPPER